MYRFIAKDPNGIPRAWGQDATKEKAETQCRWALKEYLLRGRKDFKFEDCSFEQEAA